MIPHPPYDLPREPKVRGMIGSYVKSKLMTSMKNKSRALDDDIIDLIQTCTVLKKI